MTRVTRRDTRKVPAVVGFLLAGAVLATGAGCNGPPREHRLEALPQVETTHERAVLTSLAKVPGTDLFSVRVTDVSAPAPVWLTQVADKDGTIHAVRVDAVDGRFLGASVPSGQSSGDKSRTAALVAAAKVTSEQAVDKVKKPDFGKVTDIHLDKDKRGKAVWSVTVVTVQGAQTRIYQVDAVTADVVDSRTVPSNSSIPREPASPPRSPSPSSE